VKDFKPRGGVLFLIELLKRSCGLTGEPPPRELDPTVKGIYSRPSFTQFASSQDPHPGPLAKGASSRKSLSQPSFWSATSRRGGSDIQTQRLSDGTEHQLSHGGLGGDGFPPALVDLCENWREGPSSSGSHLTFSSLNNPRRFCRL